MSFNRWKETTIGNELELIYGKSLPKTKRIEGEYPVYGSGGITGSHNEALVKGPGIIVGRKGTVGSLNYESRDYFPIDTVYYIKESPKYDLKFIYYFLKTQSLDQMNSHSAVPGLNREEVYKKMITIPEMKEQKAIANILSSLDEKIELNNQMNKTLEEMAQALFKRWFVDFEFPNENGEPYKSSGGEMVDSELGMIPKGWGIKLIGDVCDVKGGKRLPKGINLITEKNSHPYIRVRDMNNAEYLLLNSEYEYVDDETQKSIARYIVSEGDIIISIVGTIGLVSKVHKSLEGANLTENCVKLTNVKGVSEEYIYLWLMSKYGQDTIKKMTVGAVQAKLPIKNIQGINILVPTDKEAIEFRRVIASINLQMQNNLEENQALKESRDTLLPKLMSGEIRVTDLQN